MNTCIAPLDMDGICPVLLIRVMTDLSVFFQCFQLYGVNSTTLSFKQFLKCPFNPAGNRQTFMLADWSLVPCDKSFTTYQKEEILRSSAINSLKQIVIFCPARISVQESDAV